MKKWLVTCLLAIALLFVATTAMAAHIRLNGDYCEGNTFEIRKREKDYHTLYCYRCYDEFTENHWSIDTPQYKATCTKVAVCTSCLMSYGEYGPHDWGHGNPGVTTVSISATASVTAAMRSTPQAAPATAARPALRWEHAAPAAGSTTAHMHSLRGRTGIRTTKTTGLAAPSATKRKLRWAHIGSFRAPLACALSPQPPALLRPCTTQTATTATTRERILM